MPMETAWKLVWSDEFDGPRGSPVDPRYWSHELGAGGWGNGELQRYTDLPENAALDGNGNLAITARRSAGEYTSARIITQHKVEVSHGRVEARMRLPRGRGIWSAFWMLGTDLPSKPWPECGEIDILENLGHDPHTVYGMLHGPGYSGRQGVSRSHRPESGLVDDFHVFRVDWQQDRVRWYVDGQDFGTLTPRDLGGRPWAHDHPFFLLLNVAIGGEWPGDPDNSTPFPATLLIDYVRAYRGAL